MKMIKTMSEIGLMVIATICCCYSFSVFAAVDMRMLATGGESEMERNSTYSVYFQVEPSQATEISQIYAYVTRDQQFLENVSISDRIGSVAPGISWETNKVVLNFDTQGDLVTTQYHKANQDGANWSSLAQTYEVYRLSFKIKKTAPLLGTNINFTAEAAISDWSGTDVTGSVSNFSVDIIEDGTAPVTTAYPVGGYYPVDKTVGLSINEEGTIHYKIDSGDYIVYSSPVSITGGEAGSYVEKVLTFYGEDEPATHAVNQEVAHSETYRIDKEDPDFAGFTTTTPVVGLGGTATVSFEVSDLSGVLGNNSRPNYVQLGGQAMSWVSGADAGEFIYQRTITGDEADGTVVVRATDRAGNWAIGTGEGLIGYDLEGPEFSLTPDKDPVKLQELLTVALVPSETLSAENPSMKVGSKDAGYNRRESDTYYYIYLVNGRNWEATFSFLSTSDDNDGDGLPNWWEDLYGLDRNSADGDDGASGDPDGDGWSNLAEYRFYQQAGKLVDPRDYNSGGQAIPLHAGWNLVSYTVNTAWYKTNEPAGLLSGVTKERIENGNWSNFFSSTRFKGTSTNCLGAMVRDAGGGWQYYGPTQPEWQNTLEYISPDIGLWLNMAAADTLILEGPRVASDGTYPAIALDSGWNLVGILPKTCFYVEGFAHSAKAPSDLGESRGYVDVEAMIKAAFNLNDVDFNKIAGIQVMYPPPYGMKAYDATVPWMFWSLKFIQPGVGAWIKLKDGETINLKYQEL